MWLIEAFKEDFLSDFDAAFHLGLSLGGRHEMTALAALIKLHAVDVDTAAREPACQIDRVGGDLAFERRTRTPLAETRGGVGIFALE